MYLVKVRQDYCSTSGLGRMAAVHNCGYEVGRTFRRQTVDVQTADRQEESDKRGSSVFSKEITARVLELLFSCVFFCSFVGGIFTGAFPLFNFSFGSFSSVSSVHLFFDTTWPGKASTGCRDYDVNDHQAHNHNKNSELQVLYTHCSRQVSTRGLKCD